MKRVRPRGVQTSTVKKSAAASTSQWAARNSRQVVRFLRSGAGSKAPFMTVWRLSTRSAENSCGIRQS